ncbi:MAG: Multi-sensor signal transduction histidine kinase [Pedosphaera sp.]|nr:Multi-sensor signal transduction histidine kinase [Pedosphaera sp.]
MNRTLRILFVEDSENDFVFLVRELKRGGHECEVLRVETEAGFKTALAGESWDVIIADYNLPRFSAGEALRLLQESGKDLPFILVSGSVGEEVAVAAMKAGANDFLLKGSLARLVPAIERELRDGVVRAERRQAEAALRESEERHRKLSECSPAGIFETDAEGQWTYANGRWTGISGLSFPESRGLGWIYAVHPADREAVQEDWRRALAERREWAHEHRLLTPQRVVRWVRVRAAPVLSAEEVPTGYVGTVEDISAGKRAADALVAAQERLQHLVSSSPAVIYSLKVHGDELLPTWVSENIALMTGYEPKETLTSQWWAEHFHPKGNEAVEAEYSTTGSLFAEFPFRRKDGTEIWIHDEKRLLRDGAGRLVEVVGSWSDVTGRRLVEEELRSSREELRALAAHLQTVREEERKRITREIHDELGQSLTGFKMDLAWMRTRLLSEEGPVIRQPLLEKIGGMGTLLDGTASLVRRLCTELRPGVLDDLGLVAALEWQAGEYEKRTGIVCQLKLETGELEVDAERSTALFRIFQEILTNVARHAKATRVEVAMKKFEAHIFLEVKDNGVGIKEEQKAGSKSLGLLGMRERAHMLGGEVMIQGAPGKGTTVRVKVPLARFSKELLKSEVGGKHAGRAEIKQNPKSKRKTH